MLDNRLNPCSTLSMNNDLIDLPSLIGRTSISASMVAWSPSYANGSYFNWYAIELTLDGNEKYCIRLHMHHDEDKDNPEIYKVSNANALIDAEILDVTLEENKFNIVTTKGVANVFFFHDASDCAEISIYDQDISHHKVRYSPIIDNEWT